MPSPESSKTSSDALAAAPVELAGVIDHVIYHSDESGYTVLSVTVPGQRDNVAVVGNCPAVWDGEDLKATGRWTRHKSHGMQFQAEQIHCIAPSSAEGIERYLASGIIKGIGKVMAHRMVKTFGAKTLHIIEKESVRLREVPGIGQGRRDEIKKSWNEQKAVRDIMIFLHSHGVGTAHAVRIFKHYGPEAIAVVRRNPYRLAGEVWGIGFKSADHVAMKLGISPQSDIRAQAGVLHILDNLTDEGHCYCPRPDLVREAAELLGIPESTITAALDYEIAQRELIDDEGMIYPARLAFAERDIAGNIKRLARTPVTFPPIATDKAIAWAGERMKIAFDPVQASALAMALDNKIAIITGGPGVGKTTIIRALVDIYHRRRLKVFLAAPTGRAAKRLEESTRCGAQTIHRLLKFNPHSGGFEHDAEKPIDGDIFILDEVSMIDVILMHAFLRALPSHARLVLVGDVDQLPSVGPGNVLRDLIDAEVIPTTRLQTIFRQHSRSWIVTNAHNVNRGEFFELPPKSAGQEADFFFIESDEPDDVIRKVTELVSDRIPRRFHFDPTTDIQVLTPMRRNQLGAINLNEVLQKALNPSGAGIERFGRTYREGDRVLQIRNNYDKEVFNGDIGIVKQVDAENQAVRVDFDGVAVAYDISELDELDHAYACSIHKAQGSEYPAVVILMATQHFKLLQRNLLYTAITRGRKLVCLVGSTRAVQIAIHNNNVAFRRTGLKARLRAALK